jgi:hypothetical protein
MRFDAEARRKTRREDLERKSKPETAEETEKFAPTSGSLTV